MRIRCKTLELSIAVALLAAGLATQGCANCPPLEESSLKQKKKKELRELLVSAGWDTTECRQWHPDKGEGERRMCVAPLQNRWFFDEDGEGYYEEGAKVEELGGAAERVEFEWSLDGRNLHISAARGFDKYDFRIRSWEDEKMVWRESGRCTLTIVEKYEKHDG